MLSGGGGYGAVWRGLGVVLSVGGRWCCLGWRCCQGRCCPRVVVLFSGKWCCSVGSGAVWEEVLSSRVLSGGGGAGAVW